MLNTNGVTPRPDLALAIQQDMPALDGMIAHKLLPILPVAVSTAPIPGLSRRREVYRIAKPKHGGYSRVQARGEQNATFSCLDQGLEEAIDAKDIEIYGSQAAAERMTSMGLAEDVLRAREMLVATSVFNTTTFAGRTNALAAAVGAVGSDIINQVSDAVEAVRSRTGYDANRLAFSGGMLAKMRKDPRIQAQYRAIAGYTSKQEGIANRLSLEALATVFGVEEIVVGSAIRDTADEGQARTRSSVWADTMILAYYQPPLGEVAAPFLGRTFTWDEGMRSLDGTGGKVDALTGLIMEQYPDPVSNSTIMRARLFADYLVLNVDSGQLLTGG